MILARFVDSVGVRLTASWDHDGQISGADLLTKLDGWTGGVGVRSTRADRTGHGTYPEPTTRTGRSLTLGVYVERVNRAAMWEWEREMSGLFPDGGLGRLEVEADGAVLWCEVGLDGEVKPIVNVDGLWGEIELPLIAPMPWLYGPAQSVTIRPMDQGSGLVYPLYSVGGVLSYGGGEYNSVGSLTNPGNAEAWVTYQVVGEAPSGFRIHTSTGTIEWSGAVTPSSPAVVDTARSAVLVNGVDLSTRLGVASFAPVPPRGTATASFELIGGGDATLAATLTPTYL